MQRIGIFGGSFDPVHSAHLALAHEAMLHLRLDRIIWVPVGQAWQKNRVLASAAHRADMIRLAIADEPRFEIDTCELNRAGPSYTVDTVRAIHHRHPKAKLFLLIGQDQYANLHTWHHWETLFKYTRLAVANRAGHTPQPSAEVAQVPHNLRVVPLVPSDVSSTRIRTLIALGRPPISLVPEMLSRPVARYIEHYQLYASPPLTPSKAP